MKLFEEILVGVAELAAVGCRAWVDGDECCRSRMVDGCLEIGLGNLVKVLPVGTAAIVGVVVGSANSLKGEGAALAVDIVDISATGLVATGLESPITLLPSW